MPLKLEDIEHLPVIELDDIHLEWQDVYEIAIMRVGVAGQEKPYFVAGREQEGPLWNIIYSGIRDVETKKIAPLIKDTREIHSYETVAKL